MTTARAAGPPSLPGHAHNDYLHPRPLLGALELGYCSVEVDVHVVDGRLLVAHDADEIVPGRTLEALYLDPLAARLAAGEPACRDGQLLLLIDFKTAAGPTLDALLTTLAAYDLPLVSLAGDSPGLTLVLSGNRPIERVAASRAGRLQIDGRLSDLGSDPAPDFVPLVSDSWGRHFGWDGRGEMPAEQRRRLRSAVALAHRQGRRVRFWNVPHHAEVWCELLAAGVDYVSVDDLEAFAAFDRSCLY
ncbi:MAG: phosphatidylinositol-specific phospholipase C/glycerophosphodiester phosphodiesterase family protein [Thermoanaerobaculia bacterium]|nr:phosphatidylinositol-specific phospholipase C/glycerophosphodiester phosphodiesterase family protein [Thermoanaerobaculia bacterium]